MKLRKGDKVKVIAGKDKGREGTIDRVYDTQHRIIVGGVNMVKKHVRKNEQMPQGGIVDIARPFSAANVMLICPKCNKAVRVGYEIKGKKKSRICKSCNSVL